MAIELGTIAASKVRQMKLPGFFGQHRMFTRNVPINSNASRRDGIISADRDLAIERPSLSVERSAHHFEDIHRVGRSPASDTRSSPPVRITMVNKDAAESSEVDPDTLRAAEFLQTQIMLDSLVGKTIASAQIEETRIAVSTTDGLTFYFYGFMGGRSPAQRGA